MLDWWGSREADATTGDCLETGDSFTCEREGSFVSFFSAPAGNTLVTFDCCGPFTGLVLLCPLVSTGAVTVGVDVPC